MPGRGVLQRNRADLLRAAVQPDSRLHDFVQETLRSEAIALSLLLDQEDSGNAVRNMGIYAHLYERTQLY